MWAAQEGHTEVAALLLENGADDDTRDEVRSSSEVTSKVMTTECRMGLLHSCKPAKMERLVWLSC